VSSEGEQGASVRLGECADLVWNGLLDVLYPPCCLICRRGEAEPFCPACIGEIAPLSPPFCDRCGVPVAAGSLVCADCEAGSAPPFAWSQAVGQYTGVLRTAVHHLKYHRKGALARPLGGLLATALATPSPLVPKDGTFGCIVPVPLHPSKLRARGFNQAERIARVLAEQTGLPLDTTGLMRVRKTRTQTRFHASERQRNVQGVFATRSELYFDGKSILLIDDVLTTMSTVSECSRVLRNAGATRVAVLAVARGL
jgi:competence protein ComFC